MNALRRYGPRIGMAVVLGLLAVAALHLPPWFAAQRLDRALFDAWSRIAMDAAPTDIVVVDVDDPAALAPLARIARDGRAVSVVTTIASPPSDEVNELALGPSELPLDNQLLRRTGWKHGGHLWLRPDIDGVVRQDIGTIGSAEGVPSLAFAAANGTGTAGGAPDRAGRTHWLRFADPDSFGGLDSVEIESDPTRIAGKLLVLGPREPVYETPVGALSGHALLAQAIASYRAGHIERAGPILRAGYWLAAAALLGAVLLRVRPAPLAMTGAVAAGTAGLVAAGYASFALRGLWIPVAGPALLYALTGTIYTLSAFWAEVFGVGRRARRDTAFGVRDADTPAASGLDELYELARRLESQGSLDRAGDVYLRIAQADPHHRDTTRRLIALTRPDDPAAQCNPAPSLEGMPARLGRYEVLELIGQGATGRVFLGHDPSLHRLVAIKVVDLRVEFEPGEIAEAARRFRREAETAGRLSHRDILTVYDVGDSDGLAWIAMEYLRGRRLSDFASAATLLPVPVVLELGARAAAALAFAHRQNVVHRDIKPANIMYDSVLDALKITDFGIARLIDANRTRTGIVLGTPSFMAPEQLEGRNVNGHTDLFALGVSLYQLLTGRLPFRGTSMTDLMFSIANEPHERTTTVRPELPAAIDTVLDTALAKEPADRFADGEAMAGALRAVAAKV